ncbi:MAG: hypothetical protein HYS17_04835 [Micavibrio aeruginosavorus]|uniref:Uncharacterized protein n=1 Tax=Micavibrio aeruginosavorus TaxID=349221 RepID=A0A7T5R3Z5_9BACT|nr:MAG: hypothetical protein HYS17_04835 [Micavibrio aeruginosavorus]
MAFVNEKSKDGRRKTVDYNRGLILVCMERGRPEKPYIFELTYSDQKIKFYAECKLEQTPSNTQKITWKVTDVMFPDAENLDHGAVMRIIQEGLVAYGFSGRKEHIDSVHVTLSGRW